MARVDCPLYAILRANPLFFSPENDISGFKESSPRLAVPPLNILRRCAGQRCDLCTVVTAGSDNGCLAADMSAYELEKVPLHLSRAIISYHQQIALYRGFDDLLPPKHFFRIPSPLSQWTTDIYLPVDWPKLTCDVKPEERLSPARFDHTPQQRETISCWVDNCVENHPKCRAAQRGFRPTRLLWIDCFPGSKDVRLVESSSDADGVPYIALSHCWGMPSKRPITTTQANISSHKERILFEDLSRTFQDAVTIVRDLGQSYLWIDSLCIVQDDKDDWAQEASRMAEVYRESFCTISALSSRDGDDGCRVNASNEAAAEPLRYVDLDIGEYRVRLVETENNSNRPSLMWDIEYGDDLYKSRPHGNGNPLRTRAWTLQERELSVRSVHFSRSTLLWECLEMKGSAEIPHDVIRRYDEFIPTPVRVPSDAGAGAAADRDRWYGMVEDYSSRFLTYESDKLPAMAGLARSFQHDTLKDSGRYLAGLWAEHFPGALLWRVRREARLPGELHPCAAFEPRRPMRYRAPSWSWASLDAEVTYASQRVEETTEPAEALRPRIVLRGTSLDLATAGASDIFLGAARDVSITVHGQITRAVFDLAVPELGSRIQCERRLHNGDGDVIGFFYPDIMFELQFLREVVCLGVCDEVDASKDLPEEIQTNELGEFRERLMGLALLPVPESTGTGVFRRVGLTRWMKKSAFENVALSDIRIV